MPAPRRDRTTSWLSIVAPAALVVLLAVVYAGTLRARFLVWDDNDHVYENPFVIGTNGYAQAWRSWRDPSFYPLTFTTFWAEWRVANGEPWLFHLDNVLLHAGNAVMAGLLAGAVGASPGTAWAAAGVWALHPMSVASVAWIAERKNVLSLFFYLAALLAYARSLDGATPARGWTLRTLSIALGLAALLGKATAVTLPAAIVLLHWARGRALDARFAARLLPYVALAALIAALHVAREVVTPTLDPGTRLLIAARAVAFYLATFVWPRDLVAMYPHWSIAAARASGALAAGGLAAAALVAFRYRHRVPRAAWFGAGFFTINIALVVGLLWFPYLRFSWVGDHLAYTANVGLALVLVLAGAALLRRAAAPRALGTALVGGLWLGLAAASRQQTAVWRDTEHLWTDTLRHNPTSVLAHNNLGVALAEAGRKDEARRQFESSLRLQPGDPTAELNLGVDAAGRDDWAEAIGRYKRALRENPGNALAWNDLGSVAGARGQDRRAEWLYRKSLRLNPNDADAHRNLGNVLARVGRVADATAELRTAVRLAPRSVAARVDLAEALATQGLSDAAIAHYEAARRLDPDSNAILTSLTDLLIEKGDLRRAADYLTAGTARAPEVGWFQLQLAQVLAALHENDGALQHYEAALALAPTPDEKAEVQAMVGAFLEEIGRRDEAVARYERALAADPDEVDAHEGLARILASEGKLEAAAGHYAEVLRIAPDRADAAAALARVRSGLARASEDAR